MKISVDVGYSSVKAVSDTGKRIIFPSVVAPHRENPGVCNKLRVNANLIT